LLVAEAVAVLEERSAVRRLEAEGLRPEAVSPVVAQAVVEVAVAGVPQIPSAGRQAEAAGRSPEAVWPEAVSPVVAEAVAAGTAAAPSGDRRPEAEELSPEAARPEAEPHPAVAVAALFVVRRPEAAGLSPEALQRPAVADVLEAHSAVRRRRAEKQDLAHLVHQL
jgi:hypothetical protein